MKFLNCLKSDVDGTLKYQLLTSDEYCIEACVIFFWEKPAPVNICISSQVGCDCTCSFCVTGHKRFIRNLSSEEIIEQVDAIFNHDSSLKQYKFEVTYMGTGEPLHNKQNVILSARHLVSKYILLSRINISSIFPEEITTIDDILSIEAPVHFQYSLHFVSNELRKKYFRRTLAPIDSVFNLLDKAYNKTKIPYCINYILFDKINDQKEDAIQLAEMVKKLHAYLKISKYCSIECSNLNPSKNFNEFTVTLARQGVKWKTFESKGIDIRAACGHLLADIQF